MALIQIRLFAQRRALNLHRRRSVPTPDFSNGHMRSAESESGCGVLRAL
jgi:hypothetical protein